ncbi:MAG: hypothetical protein BWY76_01548 [bacterium ADurb.Bin429]|nr:MAG: hypothetical protein BWY76_01548 [bacterium ADurb.Bin429]
MDETDPTMHDVAERTADGRLTRRQWHTRDRYVAPYGLTDNGVVFASFGRIIYPGGREAKVALPNWSSNGCTYDCADPRYIAVDDGGKLTLVEVTKSPPALLKIPVDNRPGWIVPGMVFVHGTRILTVPSSGEATVMEKGMVLATLGEFGLTECTVSSRWWWGEDGTVWERSSDDTYHLLQWRTGRPRLTALRGPATLDDSVDDYTPLPFLLTDRAIALQPYAPALAAWGDERLVATTETTLRIPERLEKLVRRLFGALPPSEHFRVLTLTRDGKRVGTYTARMGKPMTNRLALYQEHLAFTEDGRHLSWVLESARGVEVYVFRTGR